MRLGIMQPYFLPYLGYFSLIKHTDKFIIFDTPQFIRHGWIERNRISNPNGGWQYISVPLKKHAQTASIDSIRINNEVNWKQKIIAQMVHYKKAPYYNAVAGLIKRALDEEYQDIVTLDVNLLQTVCDYLKIDAHIEIFSQMDLTIQEAKEPDEWALNICRAIKDVDEYWNPPGGQSFFDVSKYEQAGIDIKFQKINLRRYRQGKNEFQEGLSIIDVMMHSSSEKINEMLDDFELL